jgi:hypothetical protein
VIEQESEDFPCFCEVKNEMFSGEFAQGLCVLPITIASPSFSRCRPRRATPKMSPPEQFHQISIDEFTLLGDVARFGLRPMTIGKVAIVIGCHPRLK